MVKPNFIERDTAKILTELVAAFEAETGRILQPGQVEMLILNSFAYRETLLRSAIQDASLLNLVDYSRFPVLDDLGRLLGVNRLAATAAGCTLQFTLVNGHGGVTVPAGTRVQSRDGKIVFTTVNNAIAAAGAANVSVTAVANRFGIVGNGYTAGNIAVILDPQAFISAATNLGTTAGGADEETDAALRVRIKQAPASFSNAGSKGAYIYWTKTAHPSIIDVAVLSSAPGTVDIYPLVKGGIVTPQEVLDAVTAVCNGEKVRPLTDTVNVISPTVDDYRIEVNLTLFDTADENNTKGVVTANLEALTLESQSQLGRDVLASHIVAACMVPGVYDVAIVDFNDLIIAATAVSSCSGIIVNIIGANNG